MTGRQFHEKVTAAAQLLKWKGVAPNDSVLITLQPSVDFYAIAIAALAIGTLHTHNMPPSLLLPYPCPQALSSKIGEGESLGTRLRKEEGRRHFLRREPGDEAKEGGGKEALFEKRAWGRG